MSQDSKKAPTAEELAESDRFRKEHIARLEELGRRTDEVKAKLDAMAPRVEIKHPKLRQAGLLLGLIGLPTGGYFAIGWAGIIAGIVVYGFIVWLMLRDHEKKLASSRAEMAKKYPAAYAPGKGYIE